MFYALEREDELREYLTTHMKKWEKARIQFNLPSGPAGFFGTAVFQMNDKFGSAWWQSEWRKYVEWFHAI